MKRSKPKVRYQGFALAVPLIQEIKDKIKDDPTYRSVTDYVRQAVREKMDRNKFLSSQEKIRYDVYTKPRTYRGGKRIKPEVMSLPYETAFIDAYNKKLNKKPLAFIDAMLLAYETIIVEHGLILDEGEDTNE